MMVVKEREMPVGYDKLNLNHNILLDLPFREGTGTITKDVAKPQHPLTLIDTGGGSFTWGNLASGCPYLLFAAVGGGANDGVYLDCPAADTVDLNFTSGDYSLSVWFNWDSTGGFSEIIMGRYSTEVDGWDIYLNVSGHLPIGNTVSQRHHHSSIPGNPKSECYSEGWTPGEWHFFGMSRSGIYTPHYRNGVPVEMEYGGATMLDPDTANRDLDIGVRGTTKAENWYRGMMWRPRVWNRALEEWEWRELFIRERHLLGV